jgi:hypothetical protein
MLTATPRRPTRIPVIVHPSAELSPKASLPPATRVITKSDLQRLQDDVVRFANELAAVRSWADPNHVRDALERNRLTADKVIQAHSTALQRP